MLLNLIQNFEKKLKRLQISISVCPSSRSATRDLTSDHEIGMTTTCHGLQLTESYLSRQVSQSHVKV